MMSRERGANRSNRGITDETFVPAIAIPARNEEKRLPALLAGLAAQSWLLDNDRRLDVFIVLNNCTDGSREAVLAAAGCYHRLSIHLLDVVFDVPHAHVGSARRLAMQAAVEHFPSPQGSAILTTDADAVPAPDWVAANLRHLAGGIDLVGGLVVGNAEEEQRLGPDFGKRALLNKRYGQAVDHLASLLDPLAHDPWPRHHDHTGASIAVRADVYRAVGGLPALPFREDLAFVERVQAAGFLVRHPLDVVVGVSARLAGRATGGMADCLKTWMRAAAKGEPLLVEDPRLMLERWQGQRVERDTYAAATVGNSTSHSSSAAAAFEDEIIVKTMPAELATRLLTAMIEQAEVSVRAA